MFCINQRLLRFTLYGISRWIRENDFSHAIRATLLTLHSIYIWLILWQNFNGCSNFVANNIRMNILNTIFITQYNINCYYSSLAINMKISPYKFGIELNYSIRRLSLQRKFSQKARSILYTLRKLQMLFLAGKTRFSSQVVYYQWISQFIHLSNKWISFYDSRIIILVIVGKLVHHRKNRFRNTIDIS